VVKKLVRVRVDGPRPGRGSKLYSGEREIGAVTSAAESPRSGTIALAYVHRDFVASGSELQVEVPTGRAAALVSEIAVPSVV
jgi:aminomethyltransferase